MFKSDHIFIRLWAYFFAHNLPHQHGGVRPLSMRSTPHSVGMPDRQNTAVRLPRVFIALCGGKHKSCSRRGSASRFFRTLSSTVPGGSRDKATTLILCKHLHLFNSAKLSARWPLTLPSSRHGSTQRASLTPHSVVMPSLDERCYWLTSHWPHSAWRPSWQTHLSPWLSFS